jgi:hypothetical protein
MIMRGTGYVRWSHPENHGFLRSLQGLGRTASRIGEVDEAEGAPSSWPSAIRSILQASSS